MTIQEKNRLTMLEHELSCLRIKNAKYSYFFRNLDEKLEFYGNLTTDTEFDRGFANAIEIMKNLLRGGM